MFVNEVSTDPVVQSFMMSTIEIKKKVRDLIEICIIERGADELQERIPEFRKTLAMLEVLLKGYKEKEILNQIKDLSSPNAHKLYKRRNPQPTNQFIAPNCDDIHKTKRIINQHWKPVQQNPHLK